MVIPEEMTSVAVVVVVVLGLGHAGNETTDVSESVDMVRVVKSALAAARSAATRRVLIAIAKEQILLG